METKNTNHLQAEIQHCLVKIYLSKQSFNCLIIAETHFPLKPYCQKFFNKNPLILCVLVWVMVYASLCRVITNLSQYEYEINVIWTTTRIIEP